MFTKPTYVAHNYITFQLYNKDNQVNEGRLNMKKLLMISSFGFILLTSSFSALASEVEQIDTATEEVTLDGAGIKPGNLLYFLDKGVEDFRLWLANSEEKEAELLLKFAEERLAELNELDEDDLVEYADELYEEYGVNLETVNEMLATLIAEGKISEEKAVKLQEALGHTADVEAAVDDEKVGKVTEELKEKVKEAQTKSYAVAVATGLEEAAITTLKDQGYGYGEILKLQAISQMSGLTIEDLLFLDIYEEDEDGEREIDFGRLATELGLEKDDIKDQFKTYKNAIKDVRKEKNEERKQEKEAKRDEIKQQMNERLSEIISKHQDNFLAKIDEIFNAKLALINDLSVSDERKAELIQELNEVKADLIEEVQELVEKNELNPHDLGELNREIAKEFNEILKDVDLTEEEQAELNESLVDVENQIRPLLNSIVTRYEARHGITLTEEQRQSVTSKVLAKVDEIKEEDLEDQQEEIAELLEDLDEEVTEELDDLLGIEEDDDEEEDENDNDNNRGNGRKGN